MKRTALAFLFLAMTGLTRADDTADFLKADNWEGLMNYWTIKDGTITGKTTENPKFNTFLCSKQKYSDFELKFKVKLDKVGNSGVQIRSKITTDEKDKGKFVVAGPQCDMGAQYWGSLYGEKFGGMMKASEKADVEKLVKVDDWNDYGIVCKGKHVTITINGKTFLDGDFEKMPEDGILAWQLHQGPPMTVVFKDIEFKKLK